LTDGRGKGLEVIDCDTGKLRFLLNVSKCLDIMQVYHEGKNLSFLSKNAFTARETDFLTRFEGGMLYTCGLESVGGREGFPLHGSIHNTPAEILTAKCDEEGIFVQAIIRDTALFGKNLLLKRTIRAQIGGEAIELEDRLVNQGFSNEQYCLLYHVNVGYPLLDNGARIVAETEKITPRTDWAKQTLSSAFEMEDCVAGQEERCYFIALKEPTVSLINEKLGKKFTLSYSKDTLPCFVEWKSMASGDYALGLEPATTELDDRFAYKTIKAQEEIVFSLKLSIE
jgi:hypothetical protein